MNRIFTKGIALIALVGAMTVFSNGTAEAAFFTGQVDLTGAATKNGTQVTFTSTAVEFGTESFAAIVSQNDLVVHVNPLVYNPFPALGYSPLWTHASGLSFHLLTAEVPVILGVPIEGPNFLALVGKGVFKMAGWDDTEADWVLTVNQFGQGSFSASSIVPAVPEPASLALLGLGLAGVAAVRRRRQA